MATKNKSFTYMMTLFKGKNYESPKKGDAGGQFHLGYSSFSQSNEGV
jgi:hypothetical protein